MKMVSEVFIQEKRLRALLRVLFYLVVYFVFSIVAQIVVGIFYFAFGALLSGEATLPTALEEVPFSFLLLSSFVGLVVAIALTWLFRRFLDRRRFLDLGLRLQKGWLVQTLWGMSLGVLLMAFIFAAEWLGGWLLPQGVAPDRLPSTVGYLLLFVIVAVGEELVFRGYTLQNLEEEWGRGGALLVSSFLFAVFHGLNPNFSWLGFLGIFLAGVLLGYGYLVSGALWLPMGLHFAWNFAEGPIFSFAVSGLASPGLLVWEAGKPDVLWTGGNFGPEGGLLGFLSVILGLVLLWLWWWRRSAGEKARMLF